MVSVANSGRKESIQIEKRRSITALRIIKMERQELIKES